MCRKNSHFRIAYLRRFAYCPLCEDPIHCNSVPTDVCVCVCVNFPSHHHRPPGLRVSAGSCCCAAAVHSTLVSLLFVFSQRTLSHPYFCPDVLVAGRVERCRWMFCFVQVHVAAQHSRQRGEGLCVPRDLHDDRRESWRCGAGETRSSGNGTNVALFGAPRGFFFFQAWFTLSSSTSLHVFFFPPPGFHLLL